MSIHVYQSPLTGHWIADRHGTKDYPGSSQARQGWRRMTDAIVCAWEWVAATPSIYDGVRVQL